MNYIDKSDNWSIEDRPLTAPIKFDFDSGREKLIGVIIVTGIMLLFTGIFSGYILLTIPGGIISLIAFLFMVTTSDYLIIDPQIKSVMRHKNSLFSKKVTIYPFTDIKYVKLLDYEYEVHSKHHRRKYTRFSVHLIFRDGETKVSNHRVIVNRSEEYNFGHSIAELRDYVFKIASAVECEALYSEKIPFNERLQCPQIKKMLDEANMAYKAKNTLINKTPDSFGDRGKTQDSINIQSDFTVETKIKCYNCNSPDVLPGKKFCKDCFENM